MEISLLTKVAVSPARKRMVDRKSNIKGEQVCEQGRYYL